MSPTQNHLHIFSQSGGSQVMDTRRHSCAIPSLPSTGLLRNRNLYAVRSAWT